MFADDDTRVRIIDDPLHLRDDRTRQHIGERMEGVMRRGLAQNEPIYRVDPAVMREAAKTLASRLERYTYDLIAHEVHAAINAIRGRVD